MKILFWNTHNNASINDILCRLILMYQADIIVLSEYNKDNAISLVEMLASYHTNMQIYTSAGCKKIVVIGSRKDVQPGIQNERYSIQIIDKKYIICGMHLPCQLYEGSTQRRNIVIRSIIRDIQEHEKNLETKNTILIGDMNEDPFEEGCLDAQYFYGLPNRLDALKEKHIIENETFFTFYNPMWNYFGDFTEPQGTCYFPSPGTKNTYWHIFDQVMIRPALVSNFKSDSLQIITAIGEESLLAKDGTPNKNISDHLPIIFEIQEDSI